MSVYMSVNVHCVEDAQPSVQATDHTTWVTIGDSQVSVTVFFTSLDAVLNWTDEIRLSAERVVEQKTKALMTTLDSEMEAAEK